jgi:hypothetical protein
MPISCALARAKLARFVSELRTATTVEKATTAIKAGYLTGVTTPLKALGGNASWNALNELAIKPTAVAIDYIRAVGVSARHGFKAPPLEYRRLASSLDAEGIGAMLRGFAKGTRPIRESARETAASIHSWRDVRSGLRTFVEELSTRLDAEQVANALEFDRVKYKSPIVQTLVDGAFAVQEAADRPYYQLSFNSSLYAQAKLMAMKEGATGEGLAQRSAHYFESPTDEMLARATDDAMWATFKNRGILHEGASWVKQRLRQMAETKVDPNASRLDQEIAKGRRVVGSASSFIVETNVPFTGVPSSIASKFANLSPLGILGVAASTSPEVFARRLATTGVGAGLWAIGYELAEKGLITTSLPTNPAEKADWEARGRQPWSLKMHDYWMDARWLSPVMGPAFQGAKLHELRKAGTDASPLEVGARATAESGRFLTEQTYAQSIKRLIDALQDPEKKGTALLTSQIPTPAIVGQVTRAADPYRRAPETMGERVLDKVGADQLLPKAQGPFGDLPPRTPLERLSEVALPGRLRKSHETPVLEELDRLQVAIGKPGKKVRMLGVPLERTSEEYRALVNTIGPHLERELARLIALPEYRAATDEEKSHAIDRLVTTMRGSENKKFKGAKEEQVREELQRRNAADGSPPPQ